MQFVKNAIELKCPLDKKSKKQILSVIVPEVLDLVGCHVMKVFPL